MNFVQFWMQSFESVMEAILFTYTLKMTKREGFFEKNKKIL